MRLDKRPIRGLVKVGIAGLAAVTVLTACSSGNSNNSGSTSTTGSQNTAASTPSTPATSSAAQASGSTGAWKPPSPVPVRISLIGPPPLNLSLWADVANDQGYFNDVGLTPKFAYFGHGVDVTKSVVAGSNDIGMGPANADLSLIAQGSPIVAVAGMNNIDWQIAVSDPAVKTCQDLKGQTIADDGPTNARRIFLGLLLSTCGLTLDDTKHVAIGSTPSDIVKAAINGQVKAAVVHTPELATIQDSSKTKTWHGISSPQANASSYYSAFMVQKKYLASDAGKTATVRTVAAYILARSWIMDQANWNAFAALTAKAQGIPESAALTGIQLLQKIPFWEPGNGMNQQNIESEIQNEVKGGNIKATPPTYDQVVDQTIYPEALAMAKQINPNVQG